MENNYLYNIWRHRLGFRFPDSIYDRNWYEIGVIKQKDDNPITHATHLGGFTVIPEKNKHILVFSNCQLRDLPQTIENYDRNFDNLLSKFLEKINEYHPTKSYLIKPKYLKFEPKENSFIIQPYIRLDDESKIFHLEKLGHFNLDLNKEEFGIINEFLFAIQQAVQYKIDHSNTKEVTIPGLKMGGWGIDVLERKVA